MEKTNEYKIGYRYKWETIKMAIKMYNNRYTYREVSENLAKKGIIVSHKTVYEWVKKFQKEALSKSNVKYLKKRK